MLRSLSALRHHFRVASLALALALPTLSAHALGPHGDIYAGASFPTVSSQYGWEAGVHIKILPLIGMEGDAGGYGYGQNSSVSRTYTYLFGPRITVGTGRVKVYAHALGGRVEPSGGNYNNGAFLYGLGGGVDVRAVSRLSWRVNGDFLDAPSFPGFRSKIGRFSTGPVLRF